MSLFDVTDSFMYPGDKWDTSSKWKRKKKPHDISQKDKKKRRKK